MCRWDELDDPHQRANTEVRLCQTYYVPDITLTNDEGYSIR